MFLFQAGMKSNQNFSNVSSEAASRKIRSKVGALLCHLGDTIALELDFLALK